MTLTLPEVGRIIKLDTVLSRYASDASVSTDRAVAWHAVLAAGAPGMTFDEAQACVVEFYATAGEALTPYALIEAWRRSSRLMPHQVAQDVRSARARGLVGRDWSERDPLPPEILDRLAELRACDARTNELEQNSSGVSNAVTQH